MSTEDEIQNKFYSYNNSAKLCAEGALVNLMDGLGCSEEDIKVFWDIVWDQSLQSVCAKLNETFVPKNVYKKGGGVDSIEKIGVPIHLFPPFIYFFGAPLFPLFFILAGIANTQKQTDAEQR